MDYHILPQMRIYVYFWHKLNNCEMNKSLQCRDQPWMQIYSSCCRWSASLMSSPLIPHWRNLIRCECQNEENAFLCKNLTLVMTGWRMQGMHAYMCGCICVWLRLCALCRVFFIFNHFVDVSDFFNVKIFV